MHDPHWCHLLLQSVKCKCGTNVSRLGVEKEFDTKRRPKGQGKVEKRGKH